ncbi:MAG: TdeIII family type II restriction endonuclease [Helicobacteraceae bacterium]|jgi:type II restriction enzyme|nr:TdeIII family type II restriction endonuclease [Helicobacteraceae bacterium]
MSLTNDQKTYIQQVITACLRNKFQNYNPEPASMPFHFRLLGKDRIALYSFIHSLSTKFGTSIFEPVAKSLALLEHADAASQQVAGDQISSEAHLVIQNIMDNLSTAVSVPNKLEEIEAIRAVCQQGEMRTVKLTKVDLKIIANDRTIYLIDIKTAKPNAGGFKEFKRTLLEWVAATLAINPNARVQTLIAIPYNPYEPQPYNRWTMRGMLDLENELKVAEEFWDFLGGRGAYNDLLDCFEKAGIELRSEIDDYFARFNKL